MKNPFIELSSAQALFHNGLEVSKVLSGVGPVGCNTLHELHCDPVALFILVHQLDGLRDGTGLECVEEEKQIRVNFI